MVTRCHRERTVVVFARQHDVFEQQMMVTMLGDIFLRFGKSEERFVSDMWLAPAYTSRPELDGAWDNVQLAEAWESVMQTTAARVWPPVLTVSKKTTLNWLELGLLRLQPKLKKAKSVPSVREVAPPGRSDPTDTSASGTMKFSHLTLAYGHMVNLSRVVLPCLHSALIWTRT